MNNLLTQNKAIVGLPERNEKRPKFSSDIGAFHQFKYRVCEVREKIVYEIKSQKK